MQDYINVVNLNINTEFPYVVLNVKNDISYPKHPGFRIMHWHEDLQFIYVTKGEICIKTLDKKEIISEGEGVYINKNTVHVVEKIKNCEYKSFIFQEYFILFYKNGPVLDLVKRFVDSRGISIFAFHRKNEWCRSILNILKKLSDLEKNKNEFYSYEVLLSLSEIWLVMMKNIKIPKESESNCVNERMQKFLEFINENYMKNITLEDIARCANVSKSECLRCFKFTLRITPYRYLMDFRLLRATEMLNDDNASIGEISEMCGFNQQSYFGKCFKEKMGCSPKEYRSELKSKGQQ